MSFLLLTSLVAYNRAASTPNIVFILADDMGYGDPEPFSVYPNMNSHAKLQTPNLATMANEGMLFTDAYCGAPVCAPSRCCLMTGMHSGHCDVRANGQFLKLDTKTVANVLTDNGYDTAIFGKWGLGAQNQTAKNDPVGKGFGNYIGQVNQEYCHNYYPYLEWKNQTAYYIEENKNASEKNCGEPDYQNCKWTGDLWTQNTLDYLNAPERKTNPFYVFLSYTTPHSGAVGSNSEYDVPVPRVSTGPYWKNNGSWPRVEIDYATAVTYVDDFVGEVFATLKKQGLDDDTIVFFASDNGASNEGGQNYAFFASSGPLSGFKRSLKEGGHRTPLIVRWPNKVKAGSRSDFQWTFYDFMATAADLADAQSSTIPANDGTSMVPTLTGQGQNQKDWVYHEYCQPNEDKQGWGQAVRVGNYTGLCIGNQPKNASDIPVCDKEKTFELYDLTTDLYQTKNIASSNSDMVDKIWNIMIQQHKKGDYCTDAISDMNWD
eukprot:CAMPEP_0201570198 /NCGR_PEP_ID=MMETSP0190_2-20130828/12331_1 /ASSEMBLY_ACC=CAM_ASM_000263 /TAXON_ID=37353 /ORGANISM="Rosalina sp." /LENGTH=488 /DNA_ID=CAMNT_0047993461 /DNA_START=21 /DNA_END=1487 /DNA_ORIENTATION=-